MEVDVVGLEPDWRVGVLECLRQELEAEKPLGPKICVCVFITGGSVNLSLTSRLQPNRGDPSVGRVLRIHPGVTAVDVAQSCLPRRFDCGLEGKRVAGPLQYPNLLTRRK